MIFRKCLKNYTQEYPNLKSVADSLSKAGNNISSTMGTGKNTLDKISQETLPPATQFITSIEYYFSKLEKVSNEMRQNPSVVIRGTATPKPGPGE